MKKFKSGSTESAKFAGDLLARAFAEGLSAIFSIIAFSIIARSLTKTDYAVSNQLVTLGTLLAPIILIKMNSAFCLFFAGEKDKAILKSRFFSAIILSIPVCVLIVIILGVFKDGFSMAMFGTTEHGSYMPVMALYYILLALATLSQDFFRAVGSIKIASLLITLNAALKCALFLIAFLLIGQLSLSSVLWIYCGTELLILLIAMGFVLYYFRGVSTKIEFKPLKKYYIYALPLMPYLILSWLNTSVGKFILNHLMSLEDSGIYTFNNSMVFRVFIINTVVGYTIFPYISRFWNEGDKEKISVYLSKALNIGMLLGIPLSFGLIAVQPTIVKLLSGGNYEVDRVVVAILCVSMLFNMVYGIFAYLIDLSRKTIWYTFILLITAIINIVFNYILIPKFGIYGAALTMLITYAIQAVLTMIIGVRNAEIKLKIDYRYLLKTLIISIIMYFVTSLVYNESGFLNFTVSILVGVGVYFGVHFIINKITNGKLV